MRLCIRVEAAYRQVLGNAHVMDHERCTVLEAQFADGRLCAREFVRVSLKASSISLVISTKSLHIAGLS